MRALGYHIDDRHDSRGRDAGFEIRGVSEELLHTYSQRSQQRDQAIESFTERTGRRPTDNEVAVLVPESRSDKLTDISTADVKQRQRHRTDVTVFTIEQTLPNRSDIVTPFAGPVRS